MSHAVTGAVAGSGGGYVSARPSMTGGGAAIKAGGPSNFAAILKALRARLFVSAQQNRFLHRRFAALGSGPDSHPATRLLSCVLDGENRF